MFDQMLENRAVILVSGMSGVGKTTLVEFFIKQLRANGENIKVVVENAKANDYERRNVEHEKSRSLESRSPRLTAGIKHRLKGSVLVLEDQPRLKEHKCYANVVSKINKLMSDPMKYKCVVIIVTQDLKDIPKEWLGNTKLLCLFKQPRFHPLMFRPALSPAVAGDILRRVENLKEGHYILVSRWDDTASSDSFFRDDISGLFDAVATRKITNASNLGIVVINTHEDTEDKVAMKSDRLITTAPSLRHLIGYVRLKAPSEISSPSLANLIEVSYDYFTISLNRLKRKGLLPNSDCREWTDERRKEYLEKFYGGVSLMDTKTGKEVENWAFFQ